jgi:RNA polymerase sigma-70 factor (ECF subfamily)
VNEGLADHDLLGGGTADGELTPSATLLLDPKCATSTDDFGPIEPVRRVESSECTSEDLARRCLAGCPDSFEQLVLRYETRIFNFFRQFTGNHHDAEDLTQETFVKAHRSLHRYSPSFRFPAWLFTIARRTGASHFRSAEQFEELPADVESVEETPAAALERKDEKSSIWRMVQTLKSKQAQALWLRYAEGFSVAETARIMRTNPIYVKVMLHRGRLNLSRMLTARGLGVTNRNALKEGTSGERPNSGRTKPVS